MMKRAVVIFAALMVLCSCSGRKGIIPASDMSKIYADMFLLDSWIQDNPKARRMADSTLVYDPVFKKYGYTFQQYDASVHYYLDKPDRFEKIIKETSRSLTRYAQRLEKIDKALEARFKLPDYEPVEFKLGDIQLVKADSTLVKEPEPIEEPVQMLRAFKKVTMNIK